MENTISVNSQHEYFDNYRFLSVQKELSSTQNKNEIPLLYCHRTLKAKAPYLNLNCDNLLETTNKVDISSLFKTPESEISNENIIEEEKFFSYSTV